MNGENGMNGESGMNGENGMSEGIGMTGEVDVSSVGGEIAMDSGNDGREPLRRRYARWLIFYPRAYRAARGAEMLDTLLEVAAPGRRWPAGRELLGLAGGGLCARARQLTGAPARWWLDGLHLGVLLVLIARLPIELAGWADMGGRQAAWRPLVFPALVVALLSATFAGRVLLALPLAALAVFQECRPMLGGAAARWAAGLPVPEPGSTMTNQPRLSPLGLPLPPLGLPHVARVVLPYLVVLVGLAVLAVAGRGTVRRRGWWWLVLAAGTAVAAAARVTTPVEPRWRLTMAAIEICILLAGLAATVLARDPRWALAAGVYLLPGLAPLLDFPPSLRPSGLAYQAVLVGLALALGVAGTPRRRLDA